MDPFANIEGEDAWGGAGSLEKGQDKNKRGAWRRVEHVALDWLDKTL